MVEVAQLKAGSLKSVKWGEDISPSPSFLQGDRSSALLFPSDIELVASTAVTLWKKQILNLSGPLWDMGTEILTVTNESKPSLSLGT